MYNKITLLLFSLVLSLAVYFPNELYAVTCSCEQDSVTGQFYAQECDNCSGNPMTMNCGNWHQVGSCGGGGGSSSPRGVYKGFFFSFIF